MNILIDSLTCNPHEGSNAEAGFGFVSQAILRNNVVLLSHRDLFNIGGNPLINDTSGRLRLQLISPGLFSKFGRQTDYLSQCYFQARSVMRRFPVDLIHTVEPTQYRLTRPLAFIKEKSFILGPLNGGHAYPPVSFLDDLQGRGDDVHTAHHPSRLSLRRLAGWFNNQIVHGAVAQQMTDYAFNNARRIVIGTENCLSVIASRHHKKCARVPCFGIDVEKFSPGKTGGTSSVPVILYAGRITAFKGLDILIRAVKQISASTPLILEVAGSGAGDPADEAFERYCRELVKKLNLNEVVLFSGHVPRSRLVDAYRRCDIFCLVSLWEPLGLVYLEAMACGKPIVAMATGGPAEIIKPDFGISIKPVRLQQFIDDLANVLKQLAGDRAARDRMGTNARKHILENYTWDCVGQKMQRVYEDSMSD
jgi:glycosyltransferase involved in cell wall biosynthesis